MDSTWLDIGQVLFCVLMDRDENTKTRGQYQANLTEQAWSMNDLLHGQKITPNNFGFARTKLAIPSGQERTMLPARVANQDTGFASSCPIAEPAI